MSSKNQRRIKNYLVNPRYQLKYIFWMTGTGLALLLINGAVFYYYIRENYALLVELSPMTEEAKTQLFHELNHIVFCLGFFSIFFLGIVSMMGLIYSHKVAGPLYHFKRIFGEIAGGRRQARVRLRPSDEFHDVADKFNEMMDRLG